MQRLLAGIVLFLLASLPLTSATGEESLEERARHGDENTHLKAELDEIGGIRDRLGINLFKGTVFEAGSKDSDAAKQFLEVYRHLAKRRGQTMSTTVRRIENPRADAAAESSGDSQLFHALNEAGRQLDLSASNRESVGRFEEASRLRKLAKKIRKLLPEFESGIPTREATRRSG